ncbi:hypothetical protein BY458DRAFT_182492 [Sporodiniella umbellata]|nr:hypothetical protein BY458DRAFT_182492 [Sporodiniella umbellata]
MKEGIQSIEIKPTTDRLEFIGSVTKPHEGNRLTGSIALKISRTVKIKTITLKFKGRYRTSRNNGDLQSPVLSASVLPKLKTKVVDKSLVLQEGQHTFPWEILVPNVYPQTVTTERCSISYYLELKLSLGVGRSLIVEQPMTIQRHLIASPQSAALKNTKIHKYTSPGKIYCEIEVPKMICQGQDHFPILVRYACIHETRVKSITTHIIQSETCRLRGSAKTETEKRFGEQAALSKFVSDLSVITTNYIEPYPSNIDISPLLLIQNAPEIMAFDVESPLVAISHQLEITFDLTHSKLQTRIPIAFTTLPQIEDQMALKPISFTSPVPTL